jgi:cell division protein FtsA
MASQKPPFVMGLDIGSTKIAACVCEITPRHSVVVRGVGSSLTGGLVKGKVDNFEELQRSVEKAIQRAELASGTRVDHIITNVPAFHTSFIQNVGLIISKEPSGKISEDEKLECLKRSKTFTKQPNQTIIHMIPLYFKVDETIVSNPVSITGTHLEAKTHSILVDSDNLHAVTRMLKQLRRRITGIAYDSLGASQTYLGDDMLKKGAMLIDFGGRFTKINIFKESLLHFAAQIPIGGETITSDIAQCLSITTPEAERLKILYGNAQGKPSREHPLLCEVIQARITEWTALVQKSISFDVDPHLPIVLGGRGGLLNGLPGVLESVFHRKIITEFPVHIKPIVEAPEFASAIGLVLYGIKSKAISVAPPPNTDPFGKLNNWIKEFF